MGGNAFPKPAQRMSSHTHSLLLTHAHSALVPAFFTRAEALRDVREKADHGDLDLIAGWEDDRAWKLKGEERGEVDGGLSLGGAMAFKAEEQPCKGEEKVIHGQGDAGELVRWAYKMARALQAKEWVRRGSEISFAIPCNVVEGDADENTFYQLDVPFVPYAALDFYLISVSYSSTFLILARAVRCISKAFTLQMVGLIIRHPAYPGIPGIDVLLTPSAAELCSYLGLDQARWAEGFDNEQQVWAWLTDVKAGGMLEVAYKRMVRPRAVRQKGHKKKAGALDGLVAYLRTTQWGEGWDKDVDVETGLPLPLALAPGSRPETPLSQISTSDKVPALSPSGTATSIASSSGPLTPSTSSFSTDGLHPDAIHPDHPIPMDERALAALERWNKEQEYDAELAERRVKAAYLYERQQERMMRKAWHVAGEIRKEGLKEVEGLEERLGAVSV